ncbi:uncharacterized protein VTP21DRAFT_8981 [Calcarisporiella thermophila]|uniref:uncharacterized protein n=1 Tax=Calcarisporiella thermophila TaxID=911321 RepID=UPI0037437B13
MSSPVSEDEKPSTLAETVVVEEGKAEDQPSQADKRGAPPVDSFRGWLVVLGCFLIIFNNFGYIYYWGIYQEHYLNVEFRGQISTQTISYIGTIPNSCMFILGLFLGPMINRIGYRRSIVIGTASCFLGLILASFHTQIWQLYLTQGVMFGVGSAFMFFPAVILPTQWFEKYRGLAAGIAISGSGIGGLVLAPLIRYIIAMLGYRWALRVNAIISLVFLGSAAILSRPRLEVKRQDKKGLSFKFLTLRIGAMFCFGLFSSFGYLPPFFMLFPYAQSIGVNPSVASILSGVMSGINSLGRIVIGYAADKLGRFNTMFLCALIGGVAISLIWPLSNQLGVLILFIAIYGICGGGFVSLFPVALADLVSPEDLPTCMGVVYFSLFFGSLFGMPVAGALFDMTGRTSYLPLIEFSGAVTLFASLFVLWVRFDINRGLFVKA